MIRLNNVVLNQTEHFIHFAFMLLKIKGKKIESASEILPSLLYFSLWTVLDWIAYLTIF